MSDLTLLTDNVDDGKSVAAMLAEKGVLSVHTFSENAEAKEVRRKKLGFWKGDARVKLTTLHSFKGWEGRLLVINITHAKTQRDLALIYTGLTRLKKHPLGSCLTVVSSARQLRSFGKIWPTYEEQGC